MPSVTGVINPSLTGYVSQLSRYYVRISRDGHLGHLAVTSRGHVGRRNQPRFSIEPLQFSLREGAVGKLHERRATGAPYRVATAVPRPRRPNVYVVRSGRPDLIDGELKEPRTDRLLNESHPSCQAGRGLSVA